jgi:hypothetical protein
MSAFKRVAVNDRVVIRIVKDSFSGEYMVQTLLDAEVVEDSTYYTNSKQDALDTLALRVKEESR